MTMVQFTERKEEFREKILAEAKRLNLSENDIRAMFGKGGCSVLRDLTTYVLIHQVIYSEKILRTALKRKMMDGGFNLADFPDEDVCMLPMQCLDRSLLSALLSSLLY